MALLMTALSERGKETRRAYLQREDIKALRRKYEYDRRRRDTVSTLLTHARKRARTLGLECSIGREDISVPESCPALGIPLSVGEGKLHDFSPTVDRINPNLGYISGNVQVISWRANRIKNDATITELRMIADYLEGLNL